MGHDADRDHQPDGGPLYVGPGYHDQVIIRSSSGRTYVRFMPDGSAGGSNLTAGRSAHPAARASALAVVVSNSGRIRGATGHGRAGSQLPSARRDELDRAPGTVRYPTTPRAGPAVRLRQCDDGNRRSRCRFARQAHVTVGDYGSDPGHAQRERGRLSTSQAVSDRSCPPYSLNPTKKRPRIAAKPLQNWRPKLDSNQRPPD